MAVGDAPDLSRELELEAVDQPPQARDVVDRFTRRDLVDRGFEDFERIASKMLAAMDAPVDRA